MAMLKPPMLTGNTQTDLVRLRDYLFQMSADLDAAAKAPAAVSGTAAVPGTITPNETKAMEAVRQNAQELRSLILKSADNLQSEMDTREETYNGTFLAKSEFGTFNQNLNSRIQTNARGVVESYRFTESINATNETVQQYFTQLNGQIIRGFIDSNGERIFGIAIARDLSFDAQITDSDGKNTYYKLESSTFGLYTSTGWQFWVNGQKAGWFDSTGDGILHVRKVVAEEFFQISGKWQMKVKDGGAELEFVYIGGTA